MSTAVLDTFYGFYTPGTASRKVVGGIADDVIGALRDLGPVVERPNTFGAGTGVTYHPDHLKVAWERLVLEAGARVLLHAFVQDVVVHDGRVEALVVATKSGLQRVAGRTFVDASGDADLCHFAGFGYELGRRAGTSPDADHDVPRGQRGPRTAPLAVEGGAERVDGRGGRTAAPTTCRAAKAATTSRRSTGMTATIMTRLESSGARTTTGWSTRPIRTS